MVNAAFARLLAARLRAAAATAVQQQASTSPAAAAEAMRAFSAIPNVRRIPQWVGKETRSMKEAKRNELYKQRLLRQLQQAEREAQLPVPARQAEVLKEGASSSIKEMLPGWLSNLLPTSIRPKPAARKPAQTAASSKQPQEGQEQQAKDGKQEREDKDNKGKDDNWKGLEKQRDCSIDTYSMQCRNSEADVEPEASKPRKRSAFGLHGQRILYLRNKKHQDICQTLRLDERDQIQADPVAALEDIHLLRRIARRNDCNVMEVHDCIKCYQLMRDRINLLIDYKKLLESQEVEELEGKKMPASQEETEETIEYMRERKAKADMQMLLAARDLVNCPMRAWKAMLSKDAKCPNTQLRYNECCGAMKKSAVLARA